MDNETTIDNKIGILAQFWMDYRNSDAFESFIMYNDLGLPLSYAFAEKLAKPTDIGIDFINETFGLLLGTLGIEDDAYETLEDILIAGEVDE
ncbi:hypothetical protein UFOVP222_93 [uncultured Caudovirales phage]|uniref:Uncharacterized protein n=1 Tax=uncultured Caudovirales phage TaxID=2100421 RepID=A0A6J5TE43_9CAUD|nr:hypothetical protein UFOVP108_88 [uncultured Caudovirales phage]CAB5219581.1 hypothetical protein UFOVP222_93 [uncultured Caudovirales phage]